MLLHVLGSYPTLAAWRIAYIYVSQDEIGTVTSRDYTTVIKIAFYVLSCPEVDWDFQLQEGLVVLHN